MQCCADTSSPLASLVSPAHFGEEAIRPVVDDDHLPTIAVLAQPGIAA
jgi:hypothetical protein